MDILLWGYVYRVARATNIINYAQINTYDRNLNINNNSLSIKAHPYLINKIFDFSDSKQNQIDQVVDKLDFTTFTYTGTLPKPLRNFIKELRAPAKTSRELYQYVYFYNQDAQYRMSAIFFSNNIEEDTSDCVSSFSIN